MLPGVDFYFGQWDNNTTSGDGVQYMVDRGVRFMIAKVGQAYFLDPKWTNHKAKLEAQSGSFVRGAYWFLARDFPPGDTVGYFRPPVPSGDAHITSTYAYKASLGHGHNNYAVDIRDAGGNTEGDAVRASADGTVAAANLAWDDSPAGFFTDGSWQNTFGTRFINHAGGYRTQYTHMKNILVNAGDTVTVGQKIGEMSTVGSSGAGNPINAHVHYVHYRQSGTGYLPVKMKLLGKEMVDSRGNTYANRDHDEERWQSETIWGRIGTHGAYTGTSQAQEFLDALGGDPTGWMCVVDVEGLATSQYGLPPAWLQLKQFREEFHRQAPGYPLFIYSSRSAYNSLIKRDGNPVNAQAEGFAGIWTADYTQVRDVTLATFEDATENLSFVRTTTGTNPTPNAGGWGGFDRSTLIQFSDRFAFQRNGVTYRLDGNAYDGTVRQLKAVAYGTGDPDPVSGSVPNVYGLAEAAALTALTAAGYVVGTNNTEYHVSVPAGSITRTDPVAGTVWEAGATVNYWESLGPLTGTLVPDVVDDPEATALESFIAVGLVAGVRTTANDPTIIVGNVISTTPAAGTAVALASAVAYVVSLGPTAPGGSNDPTPAVPCD
jgi:murein DD-endopeptidase MepM/ murein hydrolase activator NlpD